MRHTLWQFFICAAQPGAANGKDYRRPLSPRKWRNFQLSPFHPADIQWIWPPGHFELIYHSSGLISYFSTMRKMLCPRSHVINLTLNMAIKVTAGRLIPKTFWLHILWDSPRQNCILTVVNIRYAGHWCGPLDFPTRGLTLHILYTPQKRTCWPGEKVIFNA